MLQISVRLQRHGPKTLKKQKSRYPIPCSGIPRTNVGALMKLAQNKRAKEVNQSITFKKSLSWLVPVIYYTIRPLRGVKLFSF